MARYLVTGGAGFIGSHLCDALASEGHDIVIVDDFSSGKRVNLDGPASRAMVIEANIGDGLPQGVGQVDAIIHLAALISGYDSLNDPDVYVRTNISALLRVIEFAVSRNVPRIVFASSSTVYGGVAGPHLTEQIVPEPMTVYAASKLMGEHLLSMYSRLHGFSSCSLRLFNVYGPRQATDHPYANVTCKFSHAAANDLPIDLYGDGTQSRDFVYVDDVVAAFLAVLQDSPSTLYNVGTGRETTIVGLISTLESITGKQFVINRLEPWPNDIQRISADHTRAQTELGFEARVDISDGLGRTVGFFAHGSDG